MAQPIAKVTGCLRATTGTGTPDPDHSYGVPPGRRMKLDIGQAYGCRLGYLTKEGQLMMVINHPAITDAIDKELEGLGQMYLTRHIENLKFQEDGRLHRLLMAVDFDTGKVDRGILLAYQKEKGLALLDLMDVGKTITLPIGKLFEAVPETLSTCYKTVPCVLDGLSMFMGTDYLVNALNANSAALKSPNLRMTVKGEFGNHYIIQLDNLAQTQVMGHNNNINDKVFLHIDEASSLELTEDFIGAVTNIDEAGMINIITPTGSTLKPVDLMERMLQLFKTEFLQAALPMTTFENADTEKIYLVHYKGDGRLYRGVIQETKPLTATVLFMDYGDTADVEYADLFLAHRFDATVARLRALGKKAYLKWIAKIHDPEKVKEILFKKSWKIQCRNESRNYESVVCLIDVENGSILNQKLVVDGLAGRS